MQMVPLALAVAAIVLPASGQGIPFPSHNFRISKDQIRFFYQSFDGQTTYACEHQIENELGQDWSVICRDEAGKRRKEYGVHLWLKAVRRTRQPKLSYELLYWVTDRTGPQVRKYSGTTIWFHLNETSKINRIEAGMSVENDFARLQLELKI